MGMECGQVWSMFPSTDAVSVGEQEPGLSSSPLHCYFHALRDFVMACKIQLSVTALLAFHNKIVSYLFFCSTSRNGHWEKAAV